MSRLLDWRRVLVYSHRWLGIAGCVLFIAWFASGIVLMYQRMPSLPPLDLTAARVEPAAALAAAGFAPSVVRLGMIGDRPIYRLSAGTSWAAIYADTGETIGELSAHETLELARAFMPEYAATIRPDAYLTDSDQWTLSIAVRPLMPLHRFAVGDPDHTELYISGLTGEAVMKTTRRQRIWGYLGAVTHWLYFTPLRKQTGLWVDTVIYLSIAGIVMCLSGLIWGLWRFSPVARFRLKRVPSRSPYAGMMKWHHYAGLLFGLTTFTWIFSGLMSMTPWDWSPGSSPTRQHREAVTGGPLNVEGVSLDHVRYALTAVTVAFTPKELEIVQFQRAPFLKAYRPPVTSEYIEWGNTDLPAFVAPQTLEHRFVSLRSPEQGAFARFDQHEFPAIAARAVAGAAAVESAWLERYDSYYYDRGGALPLPVLRVKYDDPLETWLYFDPSVGAVVHKEERLSRAERWLYHGLHSLDFPFLYYRRPLWDIVLILLSVGGIISSVTTVAPAWRRLRGHVRRLRARRTPTAAPLER
jgi:hypothetical protein